MYLRRPCFVVVLTELKWFRNFSFPSKFDLGIARDVIVNWILYTKKHKRKPWVGIRNSKLAMLTWPWHHPERNQYNFRRDRALVTGFPALTSSDEAQTKSCVWTRNSKWTVLGTAETTEMRVRSNLGKIGRKFSVVSYFCSPPFEFIISITTVKNSLLSKSETWQ